MNKAIEFNKIIDQLKGYALSDGAKEKLAKLKPYMSEREVIARTKDTTEARKMLDTIGTPPFSTMKDIDVILDLSEKGAMLTPEQLECVRQFSSASRRMKDYLKRGEMLETDISGYGTAIDDLTFLSEEISLAIRNNRVDDGASAELREIRRKIDLVNNGMKVKLESILRNRKEMFSDSFVSIRNGHFVLPVKKEYKSQISGSVIDSSSTGATYFIEPAAVAKLQEELSILKIEESNEERKILYTLTALVCDCSREIRLNIDAMETLDFIFAKGKLSCDMEAVPAVISSDRKIEIVKGKHPMLNQKECVPLDFKIGGNIRGVIITGPNTGGKTVALKTVGLLSIMAQSGLHIPCERANICMNSEVLCDVGDGQSITENLSTFSAHITNIIAILKRSAKDSLILLDELGSGTDPAEGMGIAVAILEELRTRECLFIATTHYPEIKEYAAKAEGLINARMAFDRESLKPLYRMEIGEAGESCALYIAKRLGLPKHMLEIAYAEAYKKENNKVQNEHDRSFIDTAPENNDRIEMSRLEKQNPQKKVNGPVISFEIGDSVIVTPENKIGIVCQLANNMGEVGVQIQKKKQLINYKRLKLKTSASELYPPDYDFSIIFDSVENRKIRHRMEKRYTEGEEIKIEKLK